MPAGVVLAVREHDEHVLLVRGLLEVLQPGDHRIVQRRLAARAVARQRRLHSDLLLVNGTVAGRPYRTCSLK